MAEASEPSVIKGGRLGSCFALPDQEMAPVAPSNACTGVRMNRGRRPRKSSEQAPGEDPCALPNAETAAMLFWALMASGQITMRRVGGWQTLDQAPVKQPIDLAA